MSSAHYPFVISLYIVVGYRDFLIGLLNIITIPTILASMIPKQIIEPEGSWTSNAIESTLKTSYHRSTPLIVYHNHSPSISQLNTTKHN